MSNILYAIMYNAMHDVHNVGGQWTAKSDISDLKTTLVSKTTA